MGAKKDDEGACRKSMRVTGRGGGRSGEGEGEAPPPPLLVNCQKQLPERREMWQKFGEQRKAELGNTLEGIRSESGSGGCIYVCSVLYIYLLYRISHRKSMQRKLSQRRRPFPAFPAFPAAAYVNSVAPFRSHMNM